MKFKVGDKVIPLKLDDEPDISEPIMISPSKIRLPYRQYTVSQVWDDAIRLEELEHIIPEGGWLRMAQFELAPKLKVEITFG